MAVTVTVTVAVAATSDQRPATSDQRPATSDQRPATSDQRPATSDQHGHLRVFLKRELAGEAAGVKGTGLRPVAARPWTPSTIAGVEGGMNDPEVTMHRPLPASQLTAHRRALEAAGLTLRLASRVPLPFKPIADQAIRAAASVPANLAEGVGRRGRDRMHHWRIAYGSALEVDTHLRLLRHANALHASETAKALDLFDQVRAMTWRLLHPRAA